MINRKYQTNGALLVGPVVEARKVITGETFSVMASNQRAFLALAKAFRVRRHSDGWFVDGSGHRSQIWESGNGLLGLTVVGRTKISQCLKERSWLVAKQVGEGEANFYCLWNDDNLARLTKLVRLQKRKKARVAP